MLLLAEEASSSSPLHCRAEEPLLLLYRPEEPSSSFPLHSRGEEALLLASPGSSSTEQKKPAMPFFCTAEPCFSSTEQRKPAVPFLCTAEQGLLLYRAEEANNSSPLHSRAEEPLLLLCSAEQRKPAVPCKGIVVAPLTQQSRGTIASLLQSRRSQEFLSSAQQSRGTITSPLQSSWLPLLCRREATVPLLCAEERNSWHPLLCRRAATVPLL